MRWVLGLAALDGVFLVFALAMGARHVADGAGAITNGYIIAFGIIATFALAWALRFLRLPPRLLAKARALALGSQAVHSAGHITRLYYLFPWYDDVVHFVVVFLLSLLVHEALLAWRLAGRSPHPMLVVLLVASAGIASAALWELFEWGTDGLLGTREQDDLHDTMQDMLDGTAGALLAAWWSVTKGRASARAPPRLPRGEPR